MEIAVAYDFSYAQFYPTYNLDSIYIWLVFKA